MQQRSNLDASGFYGEDPVFYVKDPDGYIIGFGVDLCFASN
jgi:hypothetical protein